jgi:hypothetical protein
MNPPFERVSFDYRSHEVPSAEGSYEHVAHPLRWGPCG